MRTNVRMMAFGGFLSIMSMLTAAAYEFVSVGDGERVTIGGDVANSDVTELCASAGATIVLPAVNSDGNAYIYTRLILKGSGTVTLEAPDEDYAAPTVAVVSGIAAEDSVTLHVSAPSVTALKVGRSAVETAASYALADIANVTFANAAGMFGLREAATVKKIPTAYSVNNGTRLALHGKNPLHLTDSLVLTNFDVVALSVDCIPASCTVHVAPGQTFYVKPCSMQAKSGSTYYTNAWFWAGQQNTSGTYPIVLDGKGARIICRNNMHLRLIADISGLGEILIRPDSNSGIKTFYRGLTYEASPTQTVTIPVNSEAEPPLPDTWRAKVAHWFDAADADSFVWYDYPDVVTNYNGYPLLIGWKDKQKGISDIYLYNRRMYNGKDPTVSQNVPQVLPYLVDDGLNGKPYVSCVGSARRLPFHSASTESTGSRAPIGGNTATFGDCTMCVMVFGSQDGGGRAILGDTRRSFARANSTVSAAWMTNAVCRLTVDGREVQPTSAKPSGGWQILSVDMSETAHELSCIGAEHAVTGTADNGGGQNYAELIFFREKPTHAERMACELYLAKKWGLEENYVKWDLDYAEIDGDGIVRLADDNDPNHSGVEEITVAGRFTGTLDVPAGKTLVVSPRPAPPTAADLPQQESITAWFDPSLDGTIDFNESGSKPTGIARLYSRTASGVDKSDGTYWLGMQGAITSSTGRFPFLLQATYPGGFGVTPTMPWMDFTAESASSGNTLRSHPISNLDVAVTGATAMSVRSVFMSVDSSAGGGNPFADTVGMTGKIKPRKGSDANDPIWASSNTVTMTHTWLGTNEVDGAATGFNGRGQVLGFELPSLQDMSVFLGFYKGGGSSERNYEHIGETLIYKTALTDEERQTVQGYLMAKWLGDLNSTYSDLTGATVTGAGTVKSASLRNLPQLDADFTGNLAGGGALAFTIDATVSTTAATDALAFDRAVALDDAGTVTVAGSLRTGTYTLLSATELTGGANLTLQMTDDRFPTSTLATTGTSLVLVVKSLGTMMLFR